MRRLIYALITLLTISITTLTAQENAQKFKFKVLKQTRSDFGLSYNFFLGDDSNDFTTSINGFGSGFLLDAFSGRISKDFIAVGTRSVNMTVGAGLAIMKYRFSEPIVFAQENGNLNYFFDEDPNHDYGNGFFGYGKSKMVIANLIVPVNLNFDVGPFLISAGGTMDVYLSGKHKRKFRDDGEKRKVVVKNNTFNDYPLNKLKFGVGSMIMHKESGLNIGFTYMLTPLFEEDKGPDLNELRISVGYNLSRT